MKDCLQRTEESVMLGSAESLCTSCHSCTHPDFSNFHLDSGKILRFEHSEVRHGRLSSKEPGKASFFVEISNELCSLLLTSAMLIVGVSSILGALNRF